LLFNLGIDAFSRMLVKPISRGHITGFIGDISPEGAAKAAAAASRAVVLRETVDAAAMAERVAVDSALALVTGTKRAAISGGSTPQSKCQFRGS
jgi:hypothetical protein